jgi:signal transduction histidine kinase
MGRGPREILLRTEASSDRALLTVADSGPGIVGLSVSEIWLPGRTTTTGGSGLGLTIVRDAAIELGGRASARAAGELGGAEFTVELPLVAP